MWSKITRPSESVVSSSSSRKPHSSSSATDHKSGESRSKKSDSSRRDSDRRDSDRRDRRDRSRSRERRSTHDRDGVSRPSRAATDPDDYSHDRTITSSKDESKRRRRSSNYEKTGDNSSSRAIADDSTRAGDFEAQVGSQGFTQFPGQFDAGLPGPPSPAAPVSAHVPDQFPGQFPAQSAAPYRPPLSVIEGGPGLAADYYGDMGSSVQNQPGVRPDTPELIVGAEPHLQPASAEAAPPIEPSAMGGVGAAASFFDESASAEFASTPLPSRPGKPSKPGKPGRTSSSGDQHSVSAPVLPTLGAAAAVTAAGYMASQHGQNNRPGQSDQSSTYYSATSNNAPSRPPSEAMSPGAPPTGFDRPDRPEMPSSHSNTGLYAAGALGAAALAAHEMGHHSGGHGSYSTDVGRQHRHRGPMGKLTDFWKDREGVAKFEEYTEYIGVCRYCFAPDSSPRDAPRVHHYRKGGRIDRERRYSSDSSSAKRRHNKTSWLGAGLAGYGLAKVGKSLWNQNGFGEGYSTRSGRTSTTSLHGSVDGKSYTSRGTTRRRSRSSSRRRSEISISKRAHSQERRRSRSRERIETGVTRDGRVYKKEVKPGFFGGTSNSTTYYEDKHRRRSRSRSRHRDGGILAAVAGATIASSAASHSRRRRSRSTSPRAELVRKKRHRSRERSTSPRGEFVRRERRDSRERTSGSRRSSETGVLGGFGSERRRKSPRKRSKKDKGFFNFGDASSSSSDAALAFGDKRSRVEDRTRKDQRSNEAAMLGLGAAAVAALAANQSSKDKLGRRRADVVAVKEVPKSRHGDPDALEHSRRARLSNSVSEEEGWESATDDESVIHSDLAFGSFYDLSRSGRRKSQESLLSDASSATDKWSWRWGSKRSKKKPKDTVYPSESASHTDSFIGPAAAGLAGAAVGAALAHRADHRDDVAASSASSLPSLQQVYPVLTSDPNNHGFRRQDSISSSQSQPPYTTRPAPVPLQQPQPVVPVSPQVYTGSSQPPIQPFPSNQQGAVVESPQAYWVDQSFDERTQALQGSRRVDPEGFNVSRVRKSSLSNGTGVTSSKEPRRRATTQGESTGVRFDLPEDTRKQGRDAPDEAAESRRDRAKRRESEEQAALAKARESSRAERRRLRDKEASTSESIKQSDTFADTSSGAWVAPAVAGIVGAAVGAAAAKSRSSRSEDGEQNRPIDGHQPSYEALYDVRQDERDSAKEAPYDHDRHADLAGKSTSKVMADESAGTASIMDKYNTAHVSQADFFAPPELREKSTDTQPSIPVFDHDVLSYEVPEIIEVGPRDGSAGPPYPPAYNFTATRDGFDPTLMSLPWSVPRLNLISPTPVPASPLLLPTDTSKDDSTSTKETSVELTGTGVREEHADPSEEESNDGQRGADPSIPRASEYMSSNGQSESPELPATDTATRTGHVPGEFGDDVEFAATLAAGLQDTGFDPSIVIDDPSYRRRDSPPGSEEDTPTARQSSRRAAPDLDRFVLDSPGTEGAPPQRGFVEGEIDKDPKDEANFAESKLSKKQKRRKSKKTGDAVSAEGQTRNESGPLAMDSDRVVAEPDSYFDDAPETRTSSDQRTPERDCTGEDEEPDSAKSSKLKNKAGDAKTGMRNGVASVAGAGLAGVAFGAMAARYSGSNKSKTDSSKGASLDDDYADREAAESRLGEAGPAEATMDDFEEPKRKGKKSKRASKDVKDLTYAAPTSGLPELNEPEALTEATLDDFSEPKRKSKKPKSGRKVDEFYDAPEITQDPRQGQDDGQSMSTDQAKAQDDGESRKSRDKEAKRRSRDDMTPEPGRSTQDQEIKMRSHSQDTDEIQKAKRAKRSSQLIETALDPAVIEATASIFGNLPPLVDSAPGSPSYLEPTDVTDWPAQRDESPSSDRAFTESMLTSLRTSELAQMPVTPSKGASPTAIPLHFRRPPLSNSSTRSSSLSSPVVPQISTPSTAAAVRPRHIKSNSTEFPPSKEFRPLYLVERLASKQETEQVEEHLPSLPSSQSASTGHSLHEAEWERVEGDTHDGPPVFKTVDFGSANDGRYGDKIQRQDMDGAYPGLLDSAQSTPRATSFANELNKEANSPPPSPGRLVHSLHDLFPDSKSGSLISQPHPALDDLPPLPPSRSVSPDHDDRQTDSNEQSLTKEPSLQTANADTPRDLARASDDEPEPEPVSLGRSTSKKSKKGKKKGKVNEVGPTTSDNVSSVPLADPFVDIASDQPASSTIQSNDIERGMSIADGMQSPERLPVQTEAQVAEEAAYEFPSLTKKAKKGKKGSKAKDAAVAETDTRNESEEVLTTRDVRDSQATALLDEQPLDEARPQEAERFAFTTKKSKKDKKGKKAKATSTSETVEMPAAAEMGDEEDATETREVTMDEQTLSQDQDSFAFTTKKSKKDKKNKRKSLMTDTAEPPAASQSLDLVTTEPGRTAAQVNEPGSWAEEMSREAEVGQVQVQGPADEASRPQDEDFFSIPAKKSKKDKKKNKKKEQDFAASNIADEEPLGSTAKQSAEEAVIEDYLGPKALDDGNDDTGFSTPSKRKKGKKAKRASTYDSTPLESGNDVTEASPFEEDATMDKGRSSGTHLPEEPRPESIPLPEADDAEFDPVIHEVGPGSPAPDQHRPKELIEPSFDTLKQEGSSTVDFKKAEEAPLDDMASTPSKKNKKNGKKNKEIFEAETATAGPDSGIQHGESLASDVAAEDLVDDQSRGPSREEKDSRRQSETDKLHLGPPGQDLDDLEPTASVEASVGAESAAPIEKNKKNKKGKQVVDDEPRNIDVDTSRQDDTPVEPTPASIEDEFGGWAKKDKRGKKSKKGKGARQAEAETVDRGLGDPSSQDTNNSSTNASSLALEPQSKTERDSPLLEDTLVKKSKDKNRKNRWMPEDDGGTASPALTDPSNENRHGDVGEDLEKPTPGESSIPKSDGEEFDMADLVDSADESPKKAPIDGAYDDQSQPDQARSKDDKNIFGEQFNFQPGQSPAPPTGDEQDRDASLESESGRSRAEVGKSAVAAVAAAGLYEVARRKSKKDKTKKRRSGRGSEDLDSGYPLDTPDPREIVLPMDRPLEDEQLGLVQDQDEAVVNRDSAIQVSDSPPRSEGPAQPNIVRDSGYHDSTDSPTNRSTRRPFSPRRLPGAFPGSDLEMESPRAGQSRESSQVRANAPDRRGSAASFEAPRSTDGDDNVSDPLKVSIEYDPSYEVSVKRDGDKGMDQSEVEDSANQLPDNTRAPVIVRSRSTEEVADPSPITSTSKERNSYLFNSSPSTRDEHGNPRSTRELPAQTGNELESTRSEQTVRPSLFGGPIGINSDSQPSPRSPLDSIGTEQRRLNTIPEQGAEESPLARKQRGSRAAQDLTGPTDIESTETDKGFISTDELISRMSWPSVDDKEETVDIERVKSREVDRPTPSPALARPHDPDRRPPSAQSDQSRGSNRPLQTPDHDVFRPGSRVSNGSRGNDSFSGSGSGTPPLRRVDHSVSSDLRAASKRGQARLANERPASTSNPNLALQHDPRPSSSTYDPVKDKGKGRPRDMADVYEGWGDVQGSPLSPTRPPSMRRRQSMQIMDLETQLEQLASDNRQLDAAKTKAEKDLYDAVYDHSRNGPVSEALEERDRQLRERDSEIEQLKQLLERLQNEVARLTEMSEGLTSSSAGLAAAHEERYGLLQREHDDKHQQLEQTSRDLQSLRQQHGELSTGMGTIVRQEIDSALAEKGAELDRLRAELDEAKEEVRRLQKQILASKPSDSFLVVRDEDYFEGACQQLCQHVQQWVLRFSKFSDMRGCRLADEVRDDKIFERLDNAILDGSDVDSYLADRVKRRDVFMSVVMTMVWEYIFTRYLFGMDREQRQKLKSLEKILGEVGPAAAVHQWRATTLTLLSKREAFEAQREQDTEAVVQEVFRTLAALLPPPSNMTQQIQESLRKVMRSAVALSIEMRTQRAEYMMLPPLQPEYDTEGELARQVSFNAALMNERSGDTTSNEELQAQQAVVRMVLFPLVVKKGDDTGVGDEEIVVCPAQVLVAQPTNPKKVVRVLSGDRMSLDNRSSQSIPTSTMDMSNVI